MRWMQRDCPLTADDRVLQKTPVSFDASVWEFWAPLMAGATLVMAEPGRHGDADYLVETVADERITVLQLVPTVLRGFLASADRESCVGLRRLFSGGEPLTAELRDRVFDTLDAELGNLYTASLPAWIAAGFEDAAESGEDLTDHRMLLIGYGSGDAAEAIPCQVVPGWEAAALRMNFADALTPSVDLSFNQYLELRGQRPDRGTVPYEPRAEFVVERVGQESAGSFQDAGIEYYRYIQ